MDLEGRPSLLKCSDMFTRLQQETTLKAKHQHPASRMWMSCKLIIPLLVCERGGKGWVAVSYVNTQELKFLRLLRCICPKKSMSWLPLRSLPLGTGLCRSPPQTDRAGTTGELWPPSPSFYTKRVASPLNDGIQPWQGGGGLQCSRWCRLTYVNKMTSVQDKHRPPSLTSSWGSQVQISHDADLNLKCVVSS